MCHGGFWKRAVDLLLARVDVVVLDLSGYHREHAGTGYELQRVIDRFPIGRAVMLASGASDERFLRAQVLAAWSQMAAGSPNEGTDPPLRADRLLGSRRRPGAARPRPRPRRSGVGGGRHVVGPGLLDLPPGVVAAADARASRSACRARAPCRPRRSAGSRRPAAAVRSAMSSTPSQRGSLRRDADQLGVLAGLVLHVQHADRPGLDPHARVHRVVEQHEGVERVAVAAERVGDEPVVGRVGRRREQPAVEEDAVVSWSISYLLRLPRGISMTT